MVYGWLFVSVARGRGGLRGFLEGGGTVGTKVIYVRIFKILPRGGTLVNKEKLC